MPPYMEVLSKSYKVDIPQVNREFPLAEKSEYLILPLSLENNSTLTGTASILEQFSGEFQIPCKQALRVRCKWQMLQYFCCEETS